MAYYAIITNGVVDGKGQCECSGENIFSIEITEDIYNNLERYTWDGEKITLNPNYEAEQAQKEQERIGNLTMTALDFITFIRQTGITLEQIRNYLDNNIELDTQLKYCQNVYCGVVLRILPVTVGDVTITSEMVINAFKTKNGEIL